MDDTKQKRIMLALVLLIAASWFIIYRGVSNGSEGPPKDLVTFDQLIGEALGRALVDTLAPGSAVMPVYLDNGNQVPHPGAVRQRDAAVKQLRAGGFTMLDPVFVLAEYGAGAGRTTAPDPAEAVSSAPSSMRMNGESLRQLLAEAPDRSGVLMLSGIPDLTAEEWDLLDTRGVRIAAFDPMNIWMGRRDDDLAALAGKPACAALITMKTYDRFREVADPRNPELDARYAVFR